jgi:PPOX class probable F420-dependent enzyme
MNLERVKLLSTQLGLYAHLATIDPAGNPHVSPIHPAWEGDTLWFFTRTTNIKCRNITHHPAVALHWQVTEAGDGLALWGTAEIHIDPETKHRLWHGVFDYNLNNPSPGGPNASPDRALIAIHPTRAVHLPNYGAGPRETW